MLNSTENLARLPGVLCETRISNLGPRPLRLDVAGFVGLAERGPLDVPVMVEDFSQYRLIFGGDLPLARVEGRPLFAHLPRAVEAFFENGGRRCYVVRVAGEGNRANQFLLPGLLQDNGDAGWQPVMAPAAWPGRWSDLVTVATSLRLLPLQIRTEGSPLSITGQALNAASFSLPLRLPRPDSLQAGDLLRLHLERAGGERYHLYMPVSSIAEEPTITAIQLFGIPVSARPAAGLGRLFRINPAAVNLAGVALMTSSGWLDLPFTAGDYIWSNPTAANNAYRLTMPLDSTVKIEAGDLLRISGPGLTPPLFFTAERVQRGKDPDAGDAVRLILDSASPLQLESAAANEAHELSQVDVLSFDLTIREGETTLESFLDLRFGVQVNHWQEVFQPAIDPGEIDPAAFSVDHFTGRSLRLGMVAAADDPLLLPVGMGALPVYRGPRPDLLASSKDGLDVYDPGQLFVDEEFANVGQRSLLALANDRLHLADQPHRLRAMHSLLPVDEVALIALPDLAHIGWEQVEQPIFKEPEPETPEPETPEGFHDCPAPPPEVEDDGAVPVVVLDLGGAGAQPSSQAWLEDLPEQSSPADHDDTAMLDVQRAMIRLCAARADLVALLSLPQHYNTQAASQWQQELTTTPEFYDGDPLSYAVAYHGWLAIRETTAPALAPLRYLPPDGFMAGMIAARELQRGAWIAPANVSVRNVVDLAPDFNDEGWAALYQRRLNIIRHQPGRYTLLSALTLAHERALRQLNVRRLLIFLRKLALREGQRYVFETNNERFRSLVQTYFENILNQILERGGLQAFQVVTNEEINTPNDYDNGRFLIALKVAPTLPIEFITITMLRSGQDAITVVGR